MQGGPSVLIVGEDSYGSRNILNAARGLALEGWKVGLGSPAAGLASFVPLRPDKSRRSLSGG